MPCPAVANYSRVLQFVAAADEDVGKFVRAEVSGCTDDDVKCPLMRGHNVTITIKFKSSKQIGFVRVLARVIRS